MVLFFQLIGLKQKEVSGKWPGHGLKNLLFQVCEQHLVIMALWNSILVFIVALPHVAIDLSVVVIFT